MPVFNRLSAVRDERITVAATAIGITPALWLTTPIAQTAHAFVETAAIRWLANGTTPTATTGISAFPGTKIELHNPNEIQNFLAIRQGTASATLQVELHA